MTVAPSVKARCAKCKLIRRGGDLVCICAKTPKHKQRQG